MHLDHKIPWNTTASHFKLVRSNPHFTPRRTNLFPRNQSSQSNDLKHFTRVLVSTIREFSTTERAKYSLDMQTASLSDFELFSNELLTYPERKFRLGEYSSNSALHNPLSADYQHLQYWVTRAESEDGSSHGYTTGDADLADAVKMLLTIASSGSEKMSTDDSEDLGMQAMNALLRLSGHPKIPLSDLDSLSWGHSFGVNHVPDLALQIYMLINIVDAVMTRVDGGAGINDQAEISLLELDAFTYFTRNALADYDYPAQNIPHRHFWFGLGVDEGWAGPESVSGRTGHSAVTDPLAHREPVLVDVREGLKEYLKMCFGLMYRYDVLLREWCGDQNADQWWEEAILQNLRSMGGIKNL